MQTIAYQEAQRINTERNQRAVLRILQGTYCWITDDEIANSMGLPPSGERSVRLIIRDLRREGYPIASESGRGYKWADRDPKAITNTIADLRSRANDLNQTADAMERSIYKEIGGKKAATLIDAGQEPMRL